MSDFYVKPGDEVRFSKTVGESDVYLFAGITGDLSPNHVNKEYMAKSSYGKLMAHGALLDRCVSGGGRDGFSDAAMSMTSLS